MGKILYFHIFNDVKEIIVCCIEEKNLGPRDLIDLDAFLAYYGQNYKVRKTDNIEGTMPCENMKCLRSHIIDANIR